MKTFLNGASIDQHCSISTIVYIYRESHNCSSNAFKIVLGHQLHFTEKEQNNIVFYDVKKVVISYMILPYLCHLNFHDIHLAKSLAYFIFIALLL